MESLVGVGVDTTMVAKDSDQIRAPFVDRRSFLEAVGLAGVSAGGLTAMSSPGAAQNGNQPGRNGKCYSLFIDNPYSPFLVGQQSILQGVEEGEDGEPDITIRVQITVLDETEEVAGVTTRVVEEREWESEGTDPAFPDDFELVEVSENYYAQTCDGTVWYFGEELLVFDGEPVENGGADVGAWRADDPDSAPGILMTTWPVAESRWQQEVAPGIAQDMAEIIEVGVEVDDIDDFDTFEDCIRVIEWNPLEGEGGPPIPLPDPLPEEFDGDEKFFAPGFGLIVDEDAELIEFTNGRPGRREGQGSI